jgi:hypothetical protein
MSVDLEHTLACTNPQCPVVPLLHAILEEVKALRQTLKNEKKPSKSNAGRLHVGRLVVALQLEYPDRVWTSDTFSKVIGCSCAAVRQTKAWKDYQIRLENEKHERPQRKGYKDKRGNFEAFDAHEENDL